MKISTAPILKGSQGLKLKTYLWLKQKNISMRRIHYLLVISFLVTLGCEEIGVSPELDITDCLTKKDTLNYKNLISNEKTTATILIQNDFDPANVDEAERDALASQLEQLNADHDTYRQAFECRYWSFDDRYLDQISLAPGGIEDEVFLDPEQFKSTFAIEDQEVLQALSQEEWEGLNVFIFPGVSRIPWEGSSEANRTRAMEAINKIHKEMREAQGMDNSQLFDPSKDYLFPHATYHQVYLSQFINALSTGEKSDLMLKMENSERAIAEKFILRAPDELE